MTFVLRRARGLIIDNDRALLMHRIKDSKEYYTLCGGKVEENETAEQACQREIFEETSLSVIIDKQIFHAEDIHDNILNSHYVFLCYYISGTPRLNGEELSRITPQNHYALVWVAIQDIPKLVIKPDIISTSLLSYLQKASLTQ